MYVTLTNNKTMSKYERKFANFVLVGREGYIVQYSRTVRSASLTCWVSSFFPLILHTVKSNQSLSTVISIDQLRTVLYLMGWYFRLDELRCISHSVAVASVISHRQWSSSSWVLCVLLLLVRFFYRNLESFVMLNLSVWETNGHWLNATPLNFFTKTTKKTNNTDK